MKYTVSLFVFTLRQRLKSPKCWLVLLLLPLMVLLAGGMNSADSSPGVTVGVVLPESSGEQLWELLSSRSNDLICYVISDADTIDVNVAAGKWDCGLIFEDDFSRCVAEGEVDDSVKLRIGPGSTLYPLVQESVSACIAQLVSPAIARDYLMDIGIYNSETGMEERLESIHSGISYVEVVPSTLDGREIPVPELGRKSLEMLLCWLVCAVIMVRMLFAASDLGRWAEAAAVKRLLPLRPELFTLGARAAAEAVLMMLSGGCAMLLLGRGLWGLLAVVGYVLFWTGLSLLLSRIPKIHSLLPVWLPLAVLISFLMSSALADISLLIPQLAAPADWLPCSLFLRICRGEGIALCVLLGLSVFFGLLACCVPAFSSSRRT